LIDAKLKDRMGLHSRYIDTVFKLAKASNSHPAAVAVKIGSPNRPETVFGNNLWSKLLLKQALCTALQQGVHISPACDKYPGWYGHGFVP
jgi:hypothetical protein